MDKKDARIIFMGTPEIAKNVLEGLIQEGYQVIALICQADKPIGRKAIMTPPPTKLLALKHNILCLQPLKMKDCLQQVQQLNPDVIITCAYGKIVPQSFLDIPKLGCINLHGSLLPELRGAAPIQYALIQNKKRTGMTLMKMVKEMDAGEMYAKKVVNIDDDDNATTLFKKMGQAAKELILEALPKYLNGELVGVKQDENKVTFANLIKPEQEKLDLNLPCYEFLGWIKGLSYEPGGYVYLNNFKFKILKACYYSNLIQGSIGQIIKARKKDLIVQLKDGQIKLLEVHLEGKKMMDASSFLNGFHNLENIVLN